MNGMCSQRKLGNCDNKLMFALLNLENTLFLLKSYIFWVGFL